MSDRLLDIRDLSVEFGPVARPLRVVDRVSFSIDAGKTLGIVGESGSGKSMTALSVLRLVPEPPARISGQILFDGRDLLKVPRRNMPAIRGKDIGMIFQEPMASLNPLMSIGDQIAEAIMLHESMSADRRRERVLDLLRLVGLPDPEGRLGAYPDQFSGGMRQRVMAAIAMACNPRLLIADEPTTALDVTIQAQVLEMMLDIRRRFNSAILLITHDLGVVAEVCERVVVMYAGKVVEDADVGSLFANALHPYTQGLLRSVPSLTDTRKRLYQIPGSVPPARTIKAGCPFRPRCPARMDRCAVEMPPLVPYAPGHRAACWAVSKEMAE
ncbi:ABC transporter ATP-binding protein [Silicimonas algicola]|uniref:Peptide/nickel transport system ATP-binding protein/oligopeptide transport system ATP-binding protein n=1 Tax=Silicimonas algicola TaxID=1826607 RepID=A0A316GFL5_9RHOB|nr:ABC transporter ATP-binding protein [Silicimonas algicola]AZQ68426.1 ABC transporter ATP-binding protein [Silicimonas algicola]PWK53487.1 peptide/nickel transport system ATP-binding protein/oligopeptide transport system ATP-binding protein [Silicimonas algicola]